MSRAAAGTHAPAVAAAFEAWPEAALILGPGDDLICANEAAQELLVRGLPPIARNRYFTQAGRSGLGGLVDLARREGGAVRERDLTVGLAGGGEVLADVAATPLDEGRILLTLHMRPQAGSPDRPGEARARRSVMGMGQMMAHEVKNPLAGIRGAAQLLRDAGGAEAMALAQLIIDETDRIRRLVDRMEALADEAAPALAPVNLHQVLDRVRAIAANGVADGLVIAEAYDPSLPPALADEDQLIQIFLNIVKNAAEAVRARGDGRGELLLSTAYRHGFRVRSADGASLRPAPLEVRITDNGPGVPERLRDHLFEPFVTTKAGGAGLGLALTAKLVAAHGGLIDFESRPGRTSFRVLLPSAPVARPVPHLELVR